MRIFIAAKINKTDKFRIINFENNYSDINWINANNIHLTLIPPFEVSNLEEFYNNMDCIKSDLISTNLIFKYVQIIPDVKTPKLIWLRGINNKQINNMIKILYEKLSIERKKIFIPHITLARIKKLELKYFSIKKEEIIIKLIINRIFIVKSKIDSKIVNYIFLKSFKLNKSNE